ncbi:MAG TPA: tetratricopeptide repeat protein [Sedimentisphaerales bacterium]|nr:tetratricopeptide repeat protein [Sedimentisphaerales bacterium]
MSRTGRKPRSEQNGGPPKGIWPAAGIFLLALFVRGLYLYESRDNPTFSAPIVDSLTYDLMARGLARGGGMTHEFFWQQFFYPFFLSIVYFFSNCSVIWAKIIQIVLGSATCALTYRLAERVFGRGAGIAAGLTAAVYGPLIFFDGELLAAGWAAFWAAALLLLFLKARDKKNAGLCFALGLCGGLSVLTRPNFIPFLAAAGVWLAAVWIRARVGLKKSAIGLLVLAAGFCAVTVPVAAKNHQVTGRFGFLPGTGGLNLYIGNNPDFEAVALRPGLEWKRITELPLKEHLSTPGEGQRFFYGKTFDYMRKAPMDFVKGLLRKGAELTSSREMPGNIDVYLFRRWSRLLGLLVWKIDGFGFPFGVLLPLALLGILLCRRKVPTPVLLFLIFYSASVILTHVEARYRMPVVVPMCVLAGAGLVKIGELVWAKRWLGLAGAGVFCAGIGLVCSIAGPFYSEQHLNYEAEMYYGLGDSLEQRGKIAEGIEAYSKAVSLKADYVEAYHNLGLLLVKQQRPEEAIPYYNKALVFDRKNAGLYEDLGLAFYAQGKTREAIEHYNRALEIDPEKASVYDNLGIAFLQMDRAAEALKNFLRAVELNPNDPVSRNNLGSLLAMQGRMREALEHFETALRIKPNDVETLSNLGSALASLGEFPKAVEKFKEALRLAPEDAGIYFNLGLCLQQQGRRDEAVQAYRKALALDPEHERSRRALQELTR